jgi:ribosomal protein S14
MAKFTMAVLDFTALPTDTRSRREEECNFSPSLFRGQQVLQCGDPFKIGRICFRSFTSHQLYEIHP